MDLKPCPFCGAKSVAGMVSHSNECFIHKLIYMHPAGEVEEAWQIRATDPLLKEMASSLENMIEAVRGGWKPSELCGEFEEAKLVMQEYREQEANNGSD